MGTLAWNGYRHFELYFGVSSTGAVMHTTNPRLFPDQISYIINHAEDELLVFDPSFMPLVQTLAPTLSDVNAFVALTDRVHCPVLPDLNLLCYEGLIAAERDDFVWPGFDGTTPSSLCYTSGTTGNPKGVLCSHRSTVIHTYARCHVARRLRIWRLRLRVASGADVSRQCLDAALHLCRNRCEAGVARCRARWRKLASIVRG